MGLIEKISVVYSNPTLIIVKDDDITADDGKLITSINFNELGQYVKRLEDQQASLGKYVSFSKGVYEMNDRDYPSIVVAASDVPVTAGLNSVVGGIEISIDDTDPDNPIINWTGGSGGSTTIGGYNVKNYGAVGDGVTDDKAAILACIAAAGTYESVYFPKGTYFLAGGGAAGSGLLLPLEGQTFFGDGQQSIIKITTNHRAITFYNGVGGNHKVEIKNLAFLGSGKAAGFSAQAGIAAIFGNEWYIHDCWFNDFSGNPTQNGGGGILGSATAPINSIGSRISNCVFTNCNGGLVLDQRCEYTTITGCKADNCNTGYFNGAGNNVFVNCVGHNCLVAYDGAAGTNSGHSQAVGCTFNHNTINVRVIDLTAGTGYTFSGCNMYQGSILVDNSEGVKFVGCDLVGGGAAGSFTFNILDTSTVLISSCRFPKLGTGTELILTVGGLSTLTEANNMDF